MTLDEARRCLGVGPGADEEEIRHAFRRKARSVHPDMHPGASPEDLVALGHEFDRAREACDILVRYVNDPYRTPPSSVPAHAEQSQRPRPTPPRTSRPAPRPAARPASSRPRTERRPPGARVGAMRFEDFVAWTDAAGFGAGARSAQRIDWARILSRSVTAVMLLGAVIGTVMLVAPH